MDTKKLTQVLIWVGGSVPLAALTWWGYFYGQIANKMGGNLSDVVGCLYSSSGPCGFVSGLAQFGGITPYNPVIFWIGVIIFGIGIILKFSSKEKSKID